MALGGQARRHFLRSFSPCLVLLVDDYAENGPCNGSNGRLTLPPAIVQYTYEQKDRHCGSLEKAPRR